MLVVNLKDGVNLEKALKELKKKVTRTKMLSELRDRKEFTKPSVRRRSVIKKAKYIQKKFKQTDQE